MPTLAFCHRWQLEEQCQKSGRPLSIIEPFKTALCEAALAAKTQNPKILLHILCDTEYGSQAIKLADKNHLPVIVAIEKSGEKLSQFVSDRSVYETLLARPKNWGVKFLWHFHVDQEKSFKKHQLKKLIELDHACKSLQRKLMLELILDSDHEISDEKYLASIKEVYECGVRPFWWKVSAFKSLKTWENFYALAKEYEPNPYALILGGSQKPLSDYAEDFFIAKSQKFGIGFAVGRSLFFESFKNYCEQKISLKDVSKNLTQPFLTLCDMWQKS